MALFVTLLTVINHKVVGGIDAAVWVMSGMLAFFMFRRCAQQGVDAIGANLALYTYRQVRPVDTILVRAILEGVLMLLVSTILFLGGLLLGLPALPDDPLQVILAVFGLWLFGIGFGLVLSVPKELIPEFSHVYGFIMMPLYFISGVVFPISNVPLPYRDWLMLNPIVHGLEATRQGFSVYYHAVPELDLSYLFGCSVFLIFFGLVLQLRFAQRMIAK